MPYGFGLPDAANQWVGGMAGAMFNPWIERAKQAYGAYRGGVDAAYNWAQEPVGGPQYGPQPVNPPMQPTPNINPYQPPVQSQVQQAPILPTPGPAPGPPPDLTDPGALPIQPIPAPSMTDSMQPDPYPPQMTVPMPPTPMESWMGDYNQQTTDMQEAMRLNTRNNAFINMGGALLAAPNWSEGLAGMGQAAGDISAGRARRQQYGMERDNNKLDSLYRMEQIRRSQEPRTSSARPQVLQDGTVIKWVEGVPYKVEAGGALNPIGLDELGGLHEGAEENERREKDGAKYSKEHAEWVAEGAKQKAQGEDKYNWWLGKNPEPINPTSETLSPPGQDTKALAEAIREDIRNNPEMMADPRAAEYLGKPDEELVALYMEERGQ